MKLPFSGKGIRLPEFRPGRRHLRALMTMMLPVLGALLMASGVQADPGKDVLAPGKEIVTATFGAGSSLAGWLILAEVVVGIITYIKTKNIFVLFGIAVVIVFTTIGFGLAT